MVVCHQYRARPFLFRVDMYGECIIDGDGYGMGVM